MFYIFTDVLILWRPAQPLSSPSKQYPRNINFFKAFFIITTVTQNLFVFTSRLQIVVKKRKSDTASAILEDFKSLVFLLRTKLLEISRFVVKVFKILTDQIGKSGIKKMKFFSKRKNENIKQTSDEDVSMVLQPKMLEGNCPE